MHGSLNPHLPHAIQVRLLAIHIAVVPFILYAADSVDDVMSIQGKVMSFF